VRELSRVQTNPQTCDFPEAKQLLRAHNQTTSKKQAGGPQPNTAPAASQKEKTTQETEAKENLTRYFISSLDPKEIGEAAMAKKSNRTGAAKAAIGKETLYGGKINVCCAAQKPPARWLSFARAFKP
jgi:hypothetical protein